MVAKNKLFLIKTSDINNNVFFPMSFNVISFNIGYKMVLLTNSILTIFAESVLTQNRPPGADGPKAKTYFRRPRYYCFSLDLKPNKLYCLERLFDIFSSFSTNNCASTVLIFTRNTKSFQFKHCADESNGLFLFIRFRYFRGSRRRQRNSTEM